MNGAGRSVSAAGGGAGTFQAPLASRPAATSQCAERPDVLGEGASTLERLSSFSTGRSSWATQAVGLGGQRLGAQVFSLAHLHRRSLASPARALLAAVTAATPTPVDVARSHPSPGAPSRGAERRPGQRRRSDVRQIDRNFENARLEVVRWLDVNGCHRQVSPASPSGRLNSSAMTHQAFHPAAYELGCGRKKLSACSSCWRRPSGVFQWKLLRGLLERLPQMGQGASRFVMRASWRRGSPSL